MEDTKIIRNGERVRHTFSDGEFARRVAALRAAMAENGIEQALFTSIHNINYYSDFLYCSFGRPYGLAVTADRVVSISANIDGGQPWRRTVGDNLVYTDWRRDNFYRAVAQILQDGIPTGVEFDSLPLQNFDKLKAALPACAFKDIARPAMRTRLVKSAEEIDHIKQGAAVCDIGGRALADAVSAGIPEHEIALESTRAMTREIARRLPRGELMDTWTWFQSGINTDGAHNPVTTRRVRAGDILSLNCFFDDGRLLHGVGAHFVLRIGRRRFAALVENQLPSPRSGARNDPPRRRVRRNRART